MLNTPLLKSLVGNTIQLFDRRNRNQKQIKGYSKTTEFNARSSAWFLIVFYIAMLVFWAYLIIAQPFVEHDGFNFWDLLGWIILYCIPVFAILYLRQSISMLKARIVVGPEKLVLDGAFEDTRRRKRYPGLYTSDMIVEIPWEEVSLIKIDYYYFQLFIETKNHERYMMLYGYFSTKVSREIAKYHKIEADS